MHALERYPHPVIITCTFYTFVVLRLMEARFLSEVFGVRIFDLQQ